MNTIKLTRENLHELSASPGKAGFTRRQIEALGFTWPPTKGWLTSLIGKEIPLEDYERVRQLHHKKWTKEPTPTELKRIIVALWALLADIDTQDDASKSDDSHFRKACYAIQQKRHQVLSGEAWDQMRAET